MNNTPVAPFSASNTLADQTVGEIVASSPNLSRVFQAHDIGFCCQGKLTLRAACERKNVPLDTVMADLEKAASGATAPSEDPTGRTLTALTEFIVEHHHDFLRHELPRIHAMAERVAKVHGGHTPSLVEVYEVFTKMGQSLSKNALRKEQVLFPAICEMDQSGEGNDFSFSGPVARIMKEHESTITAMARLSELTNNYLPPTDACNTYRALFAGLADFETDTIRLIRLENDVLFPRTLQKAS